jgi:uncharacterized membrane protein
MTETSQGRSQARSTRPQPESTAWAGWVVFAGVMLVVLGAFQVIEGLVALFKDDYYLVRPSGLVVNVNYTGWGWAHIIIGAVAIVAGLGLVAGNMAARVVGVGVAVVSAVVNMAFLAAYPVWSAIMIAVDVLVIYAIIVHGGELKDHNR